MRLRLILTICSALILITIAVPTQFIRPIASAVPTHVCPIGPHRAFHDTYGAYRSAYRRHKGVDIPARTGTPLYATESGRIIRAGWSRLGGRITKLLGNSGTSYLYAHQSRSYVYVGERVSAGELIGRVGSTGYSSGPHLHFEVHPHNGPAVNPTPYVRRVC